MGQGLLPREAFLGEMMCGLMPDQLLPGEGMLSVHQALELRVVDRSDQAPARRESAMPLPPNDIGRGVIVLMGVAELLRVIRAELRGTERFGEGKHGGLQEQQTLAGARAKGVTARARGAYGGDDPLR